MYKKILVALENSPADVSLLPHITELAKIHHSHLLLLHVSEGLTARHYDELFLKESEEMKRDRLYLENITDDLAKKNLTATPHLALGNPPEEILHVAEKENCDLIAMTSHGHRFFADLFYGSTIEEVRHKSTIPILVVKWVKD